MKKLSWICAILVFVLGLGFGVNILFKASLSKECAFCRQSIVDAQKFYEDDLVVALYTHKPLLPGHSLIIPKRHCERFEQLTEEEMAQIGKVIKKVDAAAHKVFGTSAYFLYQKNGPEVGQTVPHVHFHYVPKMRGDHSIWKFVWNIVSTNLSKPLPKAALQGVIAQMKKAVAPAPVASESRPIEPPKNSVCRGLAPHEKEAVIGELSLGDQGLDGHHDD